MKFVLPVLVLALAACQTPGGSSPGSGTPEERLTRLELKLEQYQTKAISLHSVLTDRLVLLERQLNESRNHLEIMRVDLQRMRADLDALRTGGVSKPTTPDQPTPPGVSTEEAMLRADVALQDLKKGGKIDEVAEQLKPVATVAAMRWIEAFAKHAMDLELMPKMEAVLGRLPPAALRVPVEEALKDPMRRSPAARVVGHTKDKELSRLLEAYTADPEANFCYTVGQALVDCRNAMGVPALLKALRSEFKETRFLAIVALRGLNRNESFGFDFNLDVAQNAEALKQWEAWWEKDGKKAFE